MTDLAPKLKFERIFPWVMGACVTLLSFLAGSSQADIPPAVWDDVAVAAGIRPSPEIFPHLWHLLVAGLIKLIGFTGALSALRLFGFVALGLLTVLACRILPRFIPEPFQAWLDDAPRGRLFTRVLVPFAAFLLVFSHPVWQAARIFTPELFDLLLFLLMIRCAIGALESNGFGVVSATAVCTAAIAAESLLGVFAFIFLAVLLTLRRQACEPGITISFLKRFYAVRRFATVFLASYSLFVVMNILFSLWRFPEGAAQHTFFGLFHYFVHYFERLLNASSLVGLTLVAVSVVAPFIFLLTHIRQATVLSRNVPMTLVGFSAVLAALAIVQGLPYSDGWFWTWVDTSVKVCPPATLLLCLFLNSVSALLALTVVGVEVFYRNHARLGRKAFAAVAFGSPVLPRPAKGSVSFRRLARAASFIGMLTLIVLSASAKFNSPTNEASHLLNEAAALIVEEVGDAPYLFTDGSLDAAVECRSHAGGGSLLTLAMMSAGAPHARRLRTRGVTDPETRVVLETGAAEALRTWVRQEAPMATNIAVQLGFELWIQDERPVPRVGGLVARTFPADEATRADYADRAHALADRILTLRHADLKGLLDARTYGMISFLQFRLSRLALFRAEEASARGDVVAAEREQELVRALDAANPELQQIRNLMTKREYDSALNLTPREGLAVGFFLRDVRFARAFAQQVIAFDARDFKANYALAMSALTEKDLARAEYHLSVCHRVRPRDGVVMNNLAAVLMRLGRLDEAESYAIQAVARLPESEACQKTLEDIRKKKGEGQ